MGYDLHIEGLTGTAHGIRFLSFGSYDKIQGVQGIQKLVNQFLKCLCTPKGTDLSDKNYGTVLMSMFMSNVDPGTLKQMAAIAVSDAEDQIRQFNTSNASPTSERIFGAALEQIAIDTSANTLDMSVLITNNAKTTVRLLVPLMTS